MGTAGMPIRLIISTLQELVFRKLWRGRGLLPCFAKLQPRVWRISKFAARLGGRDAKEPNERIVTFSGVEAENAKPDRMRSPW